MCIPNDCSTDHARIDLDLIRISVNVGVTERGKDDSNV